MLEGGNPHSCPDFTRPVVGGPRRGQLKLDREHKIGGVLNYYLGVLKNYAGFSGRARRAEYWMFALFNFIAIVLVLIIGAVIHFPVLYGVYTLAVLVPGLAVLTRRLHDTGRSAWVILIVLIPIVGGITLLVFTCLDGTPGPNKYGPSPKGIGGTSADQQPFSHA